jgi:cation:H+ antiporter
MAWLAFIFSGAIIVVSAMQLAKYGDAIALRTGLGRLFVGSLLLASATSLPEILTGISSFQQGVHNLTAGNLLGSNAFNITLLAAADLASHNRRVLRAIAMRHALTGSMAMVMITLVVFLLVANIGVMVGPIGLDSIILMVAYAGMIYLLQKSTPAVEQSVPEDEEVNKLIPTLRRSVIGFIVATALIAVVSPLLVRSSADIADQTGLGTSFVGLSLVAVVTSLPELVTTVALVRIGAEEMAVGNLFGSNMFNMFLVGFLDLFYSPGRFIGAIDPSFVLVGILGLLITGIALIGNVAKIERRFLGLFEIDALLIFLIYLGGMWLLYTRGIL